MPDLRRTTLTQGALMMDNRKEWLLLTCAEHGAKIGYDAEGNRQCPGGCVNPSGHWIPVVPAGDLAEATEALREIATRPTVERNPDGDDQAAHTMQLIAREALAQIEGRS